MSIESSKYQQGKEFIAVVSSHEVMATAQHQAYVIHQIFVTLLVKY